MAQDSITMRMSPPPKSSRWHSSFIHTYPIDWDMIRGDCSTRLVSGVELDFVIVVAYSLLPLIELRENFGRGRGCVHVKLKMKSTHTTPAFCLRPCFFIIIPWLMNRLIMNWGRYGWGMKRRPQFSREKIVCLSLRDDIVSPKFFFLGGSFNM